jgi:RimJ/RimL family protein N-acetyltransferase
VTIQFKTIVWSNQDLLLSWLCKRIGLAPTPHIKCIGRVASTGQIMGVVGFDGYNGSSCEMHMAGEGNWINREFLFAAFDYPFRVLKCNVVLGKVPSGNAQALKMDLKLGFEQLCEIEGGHPDGSLFILAMKRENCRWIRDAKVVPQSALQGEA